MLTKRPTNENPNKLANRQSFSGGFLYISTLKLGFLDFHKGGFIVLKYIFRLFETMKGFKINS